jgi:hypothetical protein
MSCNDENHDKNIRPRVEDRDGQAQIEYSVVGQSEGRMTSCAIHTVHKEHVFLNLASKSRSTVSQFTHQNQ